MATIQISTPQAPDTNCFHNIYIRELEKGNADVTSHFVSYFRPRLRSLLKKNGASADEMEDLQQETFARVLTAVKSARRIRHPERFSGFVKAVCKNTLLERYRNHKRYTLFDNVVHEVPDTGVSPDALLLKAEVDELVRRVLVRLPLRDQKLLRSLFMEQKSKEEICEELGVNKNHLRLLVHRAKRRFIERVSKSEMQCFAHHQQSR